MEKDIPLLRTPTCSSQKIFSSTLNETARRAKLAWTTTEGTVTTVPVNKSRSPESLPCTENVGLSNV